MKTPRIIITSFLFIFIQAIVAEPATSIVFTTNGRSRYAFDIFSLSIDATHNELRLTDGHSVNFNGYFHKTLITNPLVADPQPTQLVYVTERNGSSSIYLDVLSHDGLDSSRKRSVLESELTRSQHHLVGGSDTGRISMKDRPSLVGDLLVYVSTHEDTGVGRTSWAAVYSTQLSTRLTRRLTPEGVADFSPAVSPSGLWTAVASSGKNGWGGEVEELNTDIYVFLTQNGSSRVKVVNHGGWPSWANDSTFFFHRRGDDGWWSIYVAILPKNKPFTVDSVVTERITPPGLHTFTPAASVVRKGIIAVATRRPDSDYRHIELYDIVSGSFKDLTRLVAPRANHYNPFLSPDSSRVGYHRCRGYGSIGKMIKNDLFLENIQTHRPGISLFRIDGSFPSFSPDGERIAYVGLPGLYVANSDGSGHREIIPDISAFSTVWDPKRKGVIYTSIGPTFASVDTGVDIISVELDADELSFKKLSIGGQNNAFPSVSPDGNWIAFRSGRTGHKNLYIMDAHDGEKGGLTQLTNGPWSDTMCNWSPDGDWIAFASDRHNPGSGSFALYMIHPNGTGLRQLIHSGAAGRTNHPWFSPDGKYIVFTSDYAAVSAEPISNPHHYQPYGDIFTMKLDGSELTRLTHNSYEDGTPSWGPKFMTAEDVEWPIGEQKCSFEDCQWLAISNKHDDVKVQCSG
ncbi:Six-bladed beta-propeller, TolB-like protein [Cynara cardunculus var. scolymus]|uniref:Six-bladed beta-propeller, TolB-like protein n=2 Tax=Cynara cardunculus var. scolymus TaxID=59895 RepID=A0A118JSU4_CYNCS|nr:Six-bladed beta-propeller, TolB-like protein [Cynara cardunculus var. scolymus]